MIFFKTRLFLFSSVIALFFVLEFSFDVVEVVFGKLIYMSNPIRPKSGRLWDEENKDIAGNNRADSLKITAKRDTLVFRQLYNMQDLNALLSIKNRYKMPLVDFKNFYRTIPAAQAKTLLDPLVFLELDRNSEWQSVQFNLEDSELSIFYLDGFGNKLYEKHTLLPSLSNNRNLSQNSEFDHDPQFKGRIINAALFYEAFEKLSKLYRLQIINDPYKLVQWGDDLRRVAISSTVQDEAVKLGFEVASGEKSQVYYLNGSEMAVGYLVANVNALNRTDFLKLPEKQESVNE